VCILYDLVTELAGPLPTSTWYHVQDGKIDSVRDYFDARPLARSDDGRAFESVDQDRNQTGYPAAKSALPVFLSAEMEIAAWDSAP
jgi:hypothetical protein